MDSEGEGKGFALPAADGGEVAGFDFDECASVFSSYLGCGFGTVVIFAGSVGRYGVVANVRLVHPESGSVDDGALVGPRVDTLFVPVEARAGVLTEISTCAWWRDNEHVDTVGCDGAGCCFAACGLVYGVFWRVAIGMMLNCSVEEIPSIIIPRQGNLLSRTDRCLSIEFVGVGNAPCVIRVCSVQISVNR